MNKLTTAVWEITMGCNMRCKHCGSSCAEALPDELITSEALEVCDQLKDLGLNMSTLINMTLKQVIKRKAIPFDVAIPSYNDKLENALKESKVIEKEYKSGRRKGYNNVNEMMESIIND